MFDILDDINSPADLRALDSEQIEAVARELRGQIVAVVSERGGHLAPSLGTVELTIALHLAFESPKDKIIWDVGHQTYAHKLLTGRREFFKTLRGDDGCLGFLSRNESEHDLFGAGHAGTALSAALGMAAARDRRGGGEKVVAVLGDGALTCGISLEALNNVAETTDNLIIVLNDNKMSIAENVGAMTGYLNRIISGRGYNRFKSFAKGVLKSVPGWAGIHRGISRIEEAAKSLFVPGVLFEELGIRYVGPINGHDIEELRKTFTGIREFKRPVIVHVITEKGHGYPPAASSPEKFHGLAGFNPETGETPPKKNGDDSFSAAFGAAMIELAEKNDEVVAITAAMRAGTGLEPFAEKFPNRLFDVGIAEEHAVVFAAGMAANGLRPVVAVYASFLQRALDCVFHDVCLQNLPVIICCDRAGIVPDGPTHHGIHDLSFLKNMPNLSIVAPRDADELKWALEEAYRQESPVVIRYPRASSSSIPALVTERAWGRSTLLREGKDLTIWSLGREAETALETAAALKHKGVEAKVVDAGFIIPFDEAALAADLARGPVATIEDGQTEAGLASLVNSIAISNPHRKILELGWGREIIPHGTIAGIRRKMGMDIESITGRITEWLKENR